MIYVLISGQACPQHSVPGAGAVADPVFMPIARVHGACCGRSDGDRVSCFPAS